MAANRYEMLATWYLRFNGYFTTPDFTVHPDFKKSGHGTDADILAVRFPHSEEYQLRFDFKRDPDLVLPSRIDFVICEAKAGMCEINGTWRKKEWMNVQYAIRWMGFESDNKLVDEMAQQVYDKGYYEPEDKKLIVRLVCFGKTINDQLAEELPGVKQVLHSRVVEFLKERFTTGCVQIHRKNWDPQIVEFANLCSSSTLEELMIWVREGPKPAQPVLLEDKR